MKMLDKKLLQEDKKMFKYFQTEVKIMEKLTHPNILKAYEFFQTPKKFFVITDYCQDGDLHEYMLKNNIAYFKEEEALTIFKQIMNGF